MAELLSPRPHSAVGGTYKELNKISAEMLGRQFQGDRTKHIEGNNERYRITFARAYASVRRNFIIDARRKIGGSNKTMR
jgi:hypothetical protein